MEALYDLQQLIGRHCSDSIMFTKIPSLALMRADAPSDCEMPGVYIPMICITTQGIKQVSVGSLTLQYDTSNYLISSVDLPLSGLITEASAERPYLALGLELDLKLLATLLAELPQGTLEKGPVRGIAVNPLSFELVEAFLRLVRLLDRPADIAALSPLIVREIHYRLLTDEHNLFVRQIVQESRTAQIVRAIHWIRQNYALPMNIGDLARLAHMSPATLHRHFKAVTSMSPLQYQKRVRLEQARHIMMSQTKDAASAGFAVGYESPSQFSRDYRRLYGAPPRQDLERLRSGLEAGCAFSS